MEYSRRPRRRPPEYNGSQIRVFQNHNDMSWYIYTYGDHLLMVSCVWILTDKENHNYYCVFSVLEPSLPNRMSLLKHELRQSEKSFCVHGIVTIIIALCIPTKNDVQTSLANLQ